MARRGEVQRKTPCLVLIMILNQVIPNWDAYLLPWNNYFLPIKGKGAVNTMWPVVNWKRSKTGLAIYGKKWLNNWTGIAIMHLSMECLTHPPSPPPRTGWVGKWWGIWVLKWWISIFTDQIPHHFHTGGWGISWLIPYNIGMGGTTRLAHLMQIQALTIYILYSL